MSKIKRYDPNVIDQYYEGMEEDDIYGAYCEYSDIAPLEQELADLRLRVAVAKHWIENDLRKYPDPSCRPLLGLLKMPIAELKQWLEQHEEYRPHE